MKPFYFFLAGVGSVLSLGFPEKMRYPFQNKAKAIGSDWENIGSDLKSAIKKLEHKNEKQK